MSDNARDACLIFLHIGRTGGTTFSKLVRRKFPPARCLQLADYAELERFAARPAAERRAFAFIEGHLGFDFDDSVPAPVNYVTWLREPIARVVSSYHYMRQNPEHTHYRTIQERGLTLEQYITEKVSKFGGDNGMTRALCGLPNLAEEVPFGACTHDMLERAKTNLETRVAFLGLTEQFDAGLVYMQHALRWQLPVYTRQNIGKQNSADARLSPATRDLIAQQNALDVEFYAFARALFQKRIHATMPQFALRLKFFEYFNARYQHDPASLGAIRRFEAKRWVRALRLSYLRAR